MEATLMAKASQGEHGLQKKSFNRPGSLAKRVVLPYKPISFTEKQLRKAIMELRAAQLG